MTQKATGAASPGPIAAVLVHVPDVPLALRWYEHAFPHATLQRLEDFDFEFLVIGDICLEIVPADEKVGAGPCGSVVYWWVADFENAIQRLRRIGASLYRGPLEIQDGLQMCQLRDPWGNCIGLRGPVRRG